MSDKQKIKGYLFLLVWILSMLPLGDMLFSQFNPRDAMYLDFVGFIFLGIVFIAWIILSLLVISILPDIKESQH